MTDRDPILVITPTELKFRFELRKQIPCTLVLHNPALHTVAFKIKTTTPKKYCVRPSQGFVLPQSKVPVQITMSSHKEIPTDFGSGCRDKFLVQSVKLTEDEAREPINPDLFSKGGGKDVHEFKLKVAYISPSAPSPVKESDQEGGSPTSSAATDQNGASALSGRRKVFSAQSGGDPADSAKMATANSRMQHSEAPSMSDRSHVGADAQAATKASDKPSLRQRGVHKGIEGGAGTMSPSSPKKRKTSASPDATFTGGLPVRKGQALEGFSLLHLLITAIIAFIIGRFTHQ
mmetsp:Transcript_2417/g.5665  ORF Transcript_2417/g.5665 Transcript_2417/m.5665 type:complete len:290 (+) Transcript_2417:77-946(+)